ncbi:RDD family protein [Streptantibioticus rubrisoli]|uniref:RDD family protein n=1 Tax=Streptantibioticus rubrisoli TaxID=1387313 RepID=A0ABT1PKU2_9ACTN|nr:RDD family protein [Streptantibioticus rubrisoli]MCQ4045982.1 RDD family protein [Streptantibioticus rubrisoli]
MSSPYNAEPHQYPTTRYPGQTPVPPVGATPYGAYPPPTTGYLPPEAWPAVQRDPRNPPVLANPGQRLGGHALDFLFVFLGCVVIGIVFLVIGRVTGRPGNEPEGGALLVCHIVAMLAWVVLYDPVQTVLWGRTLGKRCAGTRAVPLARPTERLGFGQALGRWLLDLTMTLVPFLGLLNALWLLWDRPYYQCLHDKVVQTAVIRHRG